MQSNIQAVANAAYSVGLRGESLVMAIAIAGAESGYRLGAHGDVTIGGSYGPWQIYIPAHPEYTPEWLTASYENNAQAMHKISGGGSNWQPWTTYNEGTYERHMTEAREAAASATGEPSGATGGVVAKRADNLTEPFGSNLDAFLASYGGSVYVNSGFRTQAEQEALFADSAQDGVMVAFPATKWDANGNALDGSYHQRGMAVDLGWDDSVSVSEMHSRAAQYGMWFPMDYENWHMEPIGSRDGTYVPLNVGAPINKAWNPTDLIPGKGAVDAVSGVVGKLAWFTKPNNLFRIGQGWAGATLIIGGFLLMTGAAKTVAQAATAGANAVNPVGKAATVAGAVKKVAE